MTAPLVASTLPLPLLRRGKVREVYEVDADTLLLVASDRVSAFDVVLKEPVPHKGAVLTQLSAFWFGKLAAVMPSPSPGAWSRARGSIRRSSPPPRKPRRGTTRT